MKMKSSVRKVFAAAGIAANLKWGAGFENKTPEPDKIVMRRKSEIVGPDGKPKERLPEIERGEVRK